MKQLEEQKTTAASSALFKDASAWASQGLGEKIASSGTLDNRRRKTAAINAARSEEERGKNEHGKALCLLQKKAHQVHRMFGSQEQESGSVSGQ
jgi:hypothetical protein